MAEFNTDKCKMMHRQKGNSNFTYTCSYMWSELTISTQKFDTGVMTEVPYSISSVLNRDHNKDAVNAKV